MLLMDGKFKFYFTYKTGGIFMITKMKLLSTIIVVCFITGITCTKNPSNTGSDSADSQTVAADKNALAINYAEGDSAGFVTRSVGLPVSGSGGSNISWATSNSSRITAGGIITRPALGSSDTVVTLTATISKGAAGDVKAFSLTVKAIRPLAIDTGSLTDQDGNVYTTVKIGNQVWMAENLRVTKYNDGSAIPLDTSTAAWNAATPKYCYYNNTTSVDSIRKFGALYNWYAVNTGKLAPAGWHVPTDSDWNTMMVCLVRNGYNSDGNTDTTRYNNIAKSLAAKTDWAISSCLQTGEIGCDLAHNNTSGFSALPGGYRSERGYFSNRRTNGYWWSATEGSTLNARYLSLNYGGTSLLSGFVNSKSVGYSVRLVRGQ
jgi:uncharacterized protein (TIGR02145 family)